MRLKPRPPCLLDRRWRSSRLVPPLLASDSPPRSVGEAKAAASNVRQIGSRTFFRRDGQWVDSQVTKDQESKARRVKQFSDEYFELAARHGRRLSQYLVFDEPVLLNLDGQAYLIEP